MTKVRGAGAQAPALPKLPFTTKTREEQRLAILARAIYEDNAVEYVVGLLSSLTTIDQLTTLNANLIIKVKQLDKDINLKKIGVEA
jgi:hypothetical protein